MNITKIHIENFKTIKGSFKLTLNKGVNILVGDNEAGKSTIIEAIHLALTGLHNGKYLKNELSQYVFNNEVVAEYIQGLEQNNKANPLPKILIEVFIEGEETAEFEGDGNSEKAKVSGFSFKVEFDENYQKEYEAKGMMCVGRNPDSDLVEIVEIPKLKWYIGTQFHPEYQSTVLKPHPLFVDFIKTAIENQKNK